MTLVWLSSCRIHSLIPSYIFAFPDFPLTLSSFNSLSLSKEENKTLIVIMIVSPKNRRSVEEVFRDYCGRHSAIVKALTTGHSLKIISFFFIFFWIMYLIVCSFVVFCRYREILPHLRSWLGFIPIVLSLLLCFYLFASLHSFHSFFVCMWNDFFRDDFLLHLLHCFWMRRESWKSALFLSVSLWIWMMIFTFFFLVWFLDTNRLHGDFYMIGS